MTRPTDADLIARWQHEPAPLLPLLHAFHDRDGHLSEAAIRAVAKGLDQPLADLFGTVTFYHHFARSPGGHTAPRVCTGPVCAQRGAAALCAALGDSAVPMPCSGRCDAPVPVLKGNTTWAGLDAASLRPAPDSPVPPPNPGLAAGAALGTFEECVFADLRHSDQRTLSGYRKRGGFEGLRQALAMTGAEVLATVLDSKLAGRGGAGFPTGQKWKAVATAAGDEKYVVCNADEGEPGCFKDRALMDHDPWALLEGMAIAARATGARTGFVYLRYEYPETAVLLQKCIDEAHAQGLLGDFRVHLRRGAGAYVCGEEGSLLNSLEGKHPFPRNRPPFPVTHGFLQRPTAVNNVETLCAVPRILRKGAAWYRGLGLGDHAGTKLISLSGDIARPGNYEVPFGLPLRTLLHEWGGGAPGGRAIQAVTMAGLSGGFLAGADLDEVTLDEPSIRGKGSFLGAGGIMVFDDTRDMVAVAHQAMEFFAHESCGKCFPCRIGTQRLTERLAGDAGPTDPQEWDREVEDLGNVMKATSACGLGIAAPLVTDSLRRYFPQQVAAALAARS
ncbi:MAG: NADH-ubiquinone oxidoreductase-F iron-sulfur binding region domain-containing protein [Planctomycetota bacterium]